MGDIYGDMLQRDLEKLRLSRMPEGKDQDEEEDEEDDFSEIMHRDKLELLARQEERGAVPGSSPRAHLREGRSPRAAPSPFSEEDPLPLGRRLAPIGQDREEEEQELEEARRLQLDTRVRQMEEEQEEMNTSLMSLTSHYAKVQLRLQQVVAAPVESREELLQDLQNFASMGIPDMRCRSRTPQGQEEGGRGLQEEQGRDRQEEQEAAVQEQRRRQEEAILQLRTQLEELENYAYQSGDSAPPSRLLLERQRLVMERLKESLNLNIVESDIAALSEEQVKAEVDTAVGELVRPLKMKGQLVGQLQTQITDLEMFIQFLQEESSVSVPLDTGCGCEKHEMTKKKGGGKREEEQRARKKRIEEQQEKITILKRALQTLQTVQAATSLGCGGSSRARTNTLKQGGGGHYGDLRAKLEYSVEKLLDAACNTEARTEESEARGEEEPQDTEFLVRSREVTAIVRKELAVAVRDLMHHGLEQGSLSSTFSPFSGCMSGKTRGGGASMLHAWDVVTKFYEMKGGVEYNSAPARRLSRSFGLDLAPTTAGNKQALLQTIGQILASHGQYKRSPDAMFKAFVSAGLNKRKLVAWLKLVLRNQTVVETLYQSWSYTVTTGFDDAFKLLDRLSLYVFDLPVNLAVQQFQEMEEAF